MHYCSCITVFSIDLHSVLVMIIKCVTQRSQFESYQKVPSITPFSNVYVVSGCFHQQEVYLELKGDSNTDGTILRPYFSTTLAKLVRGGCKLQVLGKQTGYQGELVMII